MASEIVEVMRANSVTGGKVWAYNDGHTYWGREDIFLREKKFQNSKRASKKAYELIKDKKNDGYTFCVYAKMDQGKVISISRYRTDLKDQRDSAQEKPKKVDPGVYVTMNTVAVNEKLPEAIKSIHKCINLLPEHVVKNLDAQIGASRAIIVSDFYSLSVLVKVATLLDQSQLSITFTDSSGNSSSVNVKKASENNDELWQIFNSDFNELLPFLEEMGWEPISFQRAVSKRVQKESTAIEELVVDIF